jgi:hypothetical protein
MDDKKMIAILNNAYSEEKADFVEATNGELTEFQKGVLFGLRLAMVKVKNEKFSLTNK